MAAINPYINFDGNAEEAFSFYKSVFGGEFDRVMRYRDVPSNSPKNESESNKLVHISLPIGKDNWLMGSDRPAMFSPGTKGDNFGISISTDSEEETREIFNGLSAGGEIKMPLDKTFWNAYFGMCTDKFGIHWMVSYDYGK